MDRRKLENIAAALPVFGALLMLPPIVGIFATAFRLVGAPFIVIYLFAVWLLLIVGTLLLSQRLKIDQGSEIETDEGGAGSD